MPTSSYLKQQARTRLEGNEAARRCLLAYAGILVGLSLILTLVQYALSRQISTTGGLSGMGLRSALSAIQTFLPVLLSVLQLCLGLGFRSAMLRVARGQGLSLNSLRLGFDRFWPLVGMTVLQTLLYMALGMGCTYLSLLLFMLTPLSASLENTLAPLVSGSVLSSNMPVLDDTVMDAIMTGMLPYFALFAMVACAVILPFAYRYRLAPYYLIEGSGPVQALRSSRRDMNGNKWNYCKLDLSFWWYYLLSLLVAGIAYAPELLALCGVALPLSDTAAEFLFYGIYLAAQFLLLYAFGCQVEVTYAESYEALRPRQESSGVVLGNIFQM